MIKCQYIICYILGQIAHLVYKDTNKALTIKDESTRPLKPIYEADRNKLIKKWGLLNYKRRHTYLHYAQANSNSDMC